MADFVLGGGGSLYILTPVSIPAKDWCKDHLPEDATRWGMGYAVEHRYIGDIIEGIRDAGMEVT